MVARGSKRTAGLLRMIARDGALLSEAGISIFWPFRIKAVIHSRTARGGRTPGVSGIGLRRKPCVARTLPHQAQRREHAAAAAVRTSTTCPVVKLVFEFLVLTAARSGEVCGAQWDEIDIEDHVWTIPALRMTAMREHRVPLCGRALEILDAARTLGDGDPLVFPTARGKVLTDIGLSRIFTDLRIAAARHSFRSSFRDWAAEETDHPREVVEAALAHVFANVAQ